MRPPPSLDARFDFEGRSHFFGGPVWSAEATELTSVRRTWEEAMERWRSGLWVVCALSYESAPAFRRELSVREPRANEPLLYVAAFDGPSSESLPTPTGPVELSPFEHEMSREHFQGCVEEVRTRIAAGTTYQVNLTQRLRARLLSGNPYDLYRARLLVEQPNYAAYLDFGDRSIVSLSPELFFRLEGDRIECRPMKGTASRGATVEEDDRARVSLASSQKEQAENVMIVDLLRSDIGAVCQTGSVSAELFAIEAYASVWQLTSRVKGTLRRGVSLWEVFCSLFPCGSVTGAPKVSTMKHIAELERSPRGVYCGAIGLLEPGGKATFSVPIRTGVFAEGALSYGAGCGITWGSEPSREYEELVLKTKWIRPERPRPTLLETMRLEGGSIELLPLHMDRLARAAAHFGCEFDAQALHLKLDRAVAAHERGQHCVRALITDSSIEVFVGPIPTMPSCLRVAIARSPVRANDDALRWKTTARDTYESRKIPGFDDTLLVNERDELTEFTRGSLVYLRDERLYTPPMSSGLLPGVRRARLLAEGFVTEAPLQRRDLCDVPCMWFVNSLRGAIPIAELDGRALDFSSDTTARVGLAAHVRE